MAEIENDVKNFEELKFDITVKFVKDENSFSPVSYDVLPRSLADQIDACASELLDPDRGKVIVVGPPQTGKSFFINQVIQNFENYLEKVNTQNMTFIRLRKTDYEKILMIPNGVHTYLNALCEQFECDENELCFVTEDPNVAANLSLEDTSVRIILEISHSTFSQLYDLENKGSTKMWASWKNFDMMESNISKTKLVKLLEAMLKDKMRETYNVDLTTRIIRIFIEHVIKKVPSVLVSKDHMGDVIVVPVGIWAVCLRRLCGFLAVSNSPEVRNGRRTILPHAMDLVFEDESYVFKALSEDSDNEEDDIIVLPTGQVIRLQSAVGEDIEESEDEDHPVEPVVMNIPQLSQALHEQLFGQDEALNDILDGLIVPAAGLQDPNKPLRSFLFLGPTGVGKTKTATVIAESVADTPMNLVRLDMSEFSQPHEAAKLIGSPPGYAGYDQGGMLTNAVSKHPNSVILLDEIEKAHPRIWDSFLQILDAGRMTDGLGKTVDFTQTIIIMTSNLGAADLMRKNTGFNVMNEDQMYTERQKNARNIVLKSVESNFRPEMMNRIDETVVFGELSKDTARSIVCREIGIVSERAKKSGFILDKVSDDIVDEILSKSNVSKYGAREVQRTVFKSVSNPLARMIVKDAKHTGGSLSLAVADHVISVKEKKIERKTNGED